MKTLNEELFEACQNNQLERVVELVVQGAQIDCYASNAPMDTPLHCAVRSGYCALVKYLVSLGANVQKVNAEQDTVLHVAVQTNNLPMVKQLVNQHHANINGINAALMTPLNLAILKGYEDIFLFLLLKKSVSLLHFRLSNASTSLHLAAAYGRNAIVKRLLQDTRIDINAVSKQRETPLHVAVQHAQLEVVNTLLADPKCNVVSKNRKHQTPFELAGRVGNPEIFCALLNTGKIKTRFDRNESLALLTNLTMRDNDICLDVLLHRCKVHLNEVDNNGEHIVHVAARKNRINFLKRLLEESGLNINAINAEGKTPLQSAIDAGHYSIVKMLLEDRRIEIHAGDAPVLHQAVNAVNHRKKSTQNILTALLDDHRVDVNQCSENYDHVLGIACHSGIVETITAILQHPRILVNKLGHRGTPLMVAVTQKNEKTVDLLLAYPGMKVSTANDEYITHTNFALREFNYVLAERLMSHHSFDTEKEISLDDGAIFQYAVTSRKDTLIKCIMSYLAKDINRIKTDGFTALHDVAFIGSMPCLEMLLDQDKINVNQRGSLQKTPLHLAVEAGSRESVERLLVHPDIDINAVDSHGQSAISKAVIYNHESIFQTLFSQKNIDINASGDSPNNYTVLDYAIQKGDSNKVKQLLRHPDIAVNQTSGEFSLTPISNAAAYGYIEIIKILLQFETTDLSIRTSTGGTSLHVAAMNDQPEMLEYLLKNTQLDPNDTMNELNAPLHAALLYIHSECVDVLLRDPRVKLDLANGSGDTPIMIAYRTQQRGIVKMLGDRGEKLPADTAVNINNEQSTHHIAVHRTTAQSAKRLLLHYQHKGQSLKSAFRSLERWFSTVKPKNNSLLDKNRAAKAGFLHAKTIDYTEVHKKVTLRQLISLLWLVVHDETEIQSQYIKPLTKTQIEDEIKHRQAVIIDTFYHCRRGDSIDDAGNDDGNEDVSICDSGHFNKIIEKLVGMSRCVQLRVITSGSIAIKAQHTVFEMFRALPEKEKFEIAKAWVEEGSVPEKWLPTLKDQILHVLKATYDQFADEIDDYNQAIIDALDVIDYVTPSQFVIKWFESAKNPEPCNHQPKNNNLMFSRGRGYTLMLAAREQSEVSPNEMDMVHNDNESSQSPRPH